MMSPLLIGDMEILLSFIREDAEREVGKKSSLAEIGYYRINGFIYYETTRREAAIQCHY